MKTTTPVSGTIETNSFLWGMAKNPLDPSRSPGGSSGGEAGLLLWEDLSLEWVLTLAAPFVSLQRCVALLASFLPRTAFQEARSEIYVEKKPKELLGL